ncbi:MAG: hypothetical protein IPM79_05770 [Polyangiaceae bacterium]|jgi:hypothetical protein|nr:hypothetical protein [Polyangiaceae bacterium]MBK8937148.1 hypothetical protein [Polyangiaceae bacterium]
MLRISSVASAFAAVALTSSVALADPLVVATDPASTPAPVASVASAPAPPPPAARPADAPTRPKRLRNKTVLGGSATALSTFVMDGDEPGAMARVSLDLYASIGLGDVSVLIGGPVLVIEASAFQSHAEAAVPFMAQMGLRADEWMALFGAGVVLSGDITSEAPPSSEPSPRVELRGGPRLDSGLELCGYAAYEHHRVDGPGDTHRFFGGLSVGYGGDG